MNMLSLKSLQKECGLWWQRASSIPMSCVSQGTSGCHHFSFKCLCQRLSSQTLPFYPQQGFRVRRSPGKRIFSSLTAGKVSRTRGLASSALGFHLPVCLRVPQRQLRFVLCTLITKQAQNPGWVQDVCRPFETEHHPGAGPQDVINTQVLSATGCEMNRR